MRSLSHWHTAACVQGIKRHSLFSTPDGPEHDRIRRCMTRCFNTDSVAIGRLTTNVEVAIAAVAAAYAGPAAAAAAGATSAAGVPS